MEHKEREARTMGAESWDKLEVVARQLRYVFLIAAASVFIAANLEAFENNRIGLWLFFGFGILWVLSVAYVDVRESIRLSHACRLRSETSRQRSFVHRRHGTNRVVRWLRINATKTAVAVVLGAALVIYLIPLHPSKPWWGVILIALGPLATWLSSRTERKGRDNANLIRQLRLLVKDAGDLEFTIRSFAHELFRNAEVQTGLGGLGVRGWSSYIESLGAWQLDALSTLRMDLTEADPFERSEVTSILRSFSQILARLTSAESQLVAVCQMISDVPAEVSSRWEYIQQAHQRLGIQLSNLKPMFSDLELEDLFNGFINGTPQDLRQTN